MDKKYIEKLKNQLSIDGWNGSTEHLDTIVTAIEKEIDIDRFLFLSELRTSSKIRNVETLEKIFEKFKEEVLEHATVFESYSFNEHMIKIIFFNKNSEFIEYTFHSLYDLQSSPYRKKGNNDNWDIENIVINEEQFIYVIEQ